MTPLTSFLPFVIPYARGASDLAAEKELREAAIEFCTDSGVLRWWTGDLSITANDPIVVITPPAETKLHEVRQVTYDKKTIDAVDDDVLRRLNLNEQSEGSAPVGYRTEYNDTTGQANLRMYPIVTVAISNIIRVQVKLIPTRTAVNVNTILYEKWAAAIGAGALSRLHASDPKESPWARPQDVTFYRGQFLGGIGDAQSWIRSYGNSDVRRAHAQFL